MSLTVSSKIEFNYEYISDQSDLERVGNWASDKRYFVYDLETTGLNPFQDDIVLTQVGNSEKQWIIDARVVDIDPLRGYWEDKAWVNLAHHGQFDLKFLMWHKKWNPVQQADTMLAELILRAGLGMSASMEACGKHYLGISIPKDDELRRSFGKTPVNEFSTEQLEYAAGDVIYPEYFAKHQKEIINKRGLRNTLSLEHAVLPVIAKMELAGMNIDKDAWTILYQEALEGCNKQKALLDELLGVQVLRQENMFDDNPDIINQVNYNSPPQVRKILKKRGYNLSSTASPVLALAAIKGELPRDIAAAIIAYRIFTTRATRYGINFFDAIEPSTGNVHGDFTQCFTATGRLSSGNKSEKREVKRVNLQNIPGLKSYRKCFIPRAGRVYIVYDLQAIEPRILGDMSLDPTYIETFRTGADIYSKIGTPIYNEEVSKAEGRPSELRAKAKIGVLGTSYGTGKPKFHRKMLIDLNADEEGFLKSSLEYIDREDSDLLWEGIFEVCPSIKDSLDRSSMLADPLTSNRRVYDERAAAEPYKEVYGRLMEILEDNPYLSEEQRRYKAAEYASERGLISYSESLNGRKRFFKKYHRSWWTDGRNHPIQSTAADILKTAMVHVYQIIENNGYDAVIINQAHDELVIDCAETDAEELSPKVKAAMEAAGNKFLRVVPCKASGGIREFWDKD